LLRFFRRYNKYILTVFATLLMIVFLIQPAMQGCTPGPSEQPIGYIGDEPLNWEDQRHAHMQMQVLRRLGLRQGGDDDDDLFNWMLALQEARRMGLSASERQVGQIYAAMAATDDDISRVARLLQVSKAFLREAVRDWAMVQTYRRLAYTIMPEAQGGERSLRTMTMDTSGPLLQRMVDSVQSTVKLSLVVIDARRHVEEVPEPTEGSLLDLYERFKDALPGAGEPHGFGYHRPRQIRVETLEVSVDDLLEQVETTERDALAYYKDHPDQFKAPAVPQGAEPGVTEAVTPPTETMPYEKVRQSVHEKLRLTKADRRADLVMAFARKVMLDEVAELPLKDGWKVLPEAFSPVPLDEIRRLVKQKHQVDLRSLDTGSPWLSRQQLGSLEGLSSAVASSSSSRSRPVAFADYAMGVKELAASEDESPAPLRLQMMLPSVALSGGRSRYLFRVVEVAEARTPELDEVRDEVARDARLLAAYEKLVADAPTWVSRAKTVGLEKLAENVETTVKVTAPFPRREFFYGLRVPSVEGVGRDAAFVDRVFASASPARAADAAQPQEQRPMTAIGVDRGLLLVVARYDAFEALPRSKFNEMANARDLGLMASLYLADENDSDAVSLEAIKARLDFRDAP
jgi:hypothetical protein